MRSNGLRNGNSWRGRKKEMRSSLCRDCNPNSFSKTFVGVAVGIIASGVGGGQHDAALAHPCLDGRRQARRQTIADHDQHLVILQSLFANVLFHDEIRRRAEKGQRRPQTEAVHVGVQPHLAEIRTEQVVAGQNPSRCRRSPSARCWR